MKTENGKIIEATRNELYHRWLTEDWDEITSFPCFLETMRQCGVTIKEEDDGAEKTTVPT